jgi:hypothetical protein
MREKRIAQKLADLFADSRINEIELGNQTASLFNATIEAKAQEWLAWHNAAKTFDNYTHEKDRNVTDPN